MNLSAKRASLGLLVFTLVFSGCVAASEDETIDAVAVSEAKKIDAVRERAEALLQLLRAERWKDADDFVLVDEATRQRMGIPEGASRERRRERIAGWFEGLYGVLKPGSVRSVRLDPKDPNHAYVDYRCGDLDQFHMHLAEGEWYYTLRY